MFWIALVLIFIVTITIAFIILEKSSINNHKKNINYKPQNERKDKSTPHGY